MLLSLALALVLPADLGDAVPAHEEAPPEEASAAPEDEALPAAACAALFGGDVDRDLRRASRETRLEEVVRTEMLLDVVHTDPKWQPPKPMRVPGIEVVELVETPEGGKRARVRLTSAWGELCPAGDYLVDADDGLGSEGLVLAILDEGVLAEHRGELIFLPKTGSHSPAFRMIWRSGFGMNVAAGSAKGPARKPTTAAAKKRAQKPRAKASAKAAVGRPMPARAVRTRR